MVDIESGKGLDALITANKVLVITKSTCPYCHQALDILSREGVDPHEVAVDKLGEAERKSLQAELRSTYNHSTYPAIFINGEFVGGCDDLVALKKNGGLSAKIYGAGTTIMDDLNNASGDLDSLLAMHDKALANGKTFDPVDKNNDTYDAKEASSGRTAAYRPLFFFPEVVESNTIRLIGLQVVVILIVGIIWRERTWTHYMILGLALDNLARFVWGPGPSPLAQIAKIASFLLVAPKFKPGMPKQFANACGLFMSVVATIFLFVTGFDSQRIIASCFMGVYAGLAALEFGIDFCMGCYIFGWMVRYGVFPSEVYALCVSTVPEASYTYDEATKKLSLDVPEHVRLNFPGFPASDADVRYKTKSNDHDAQSFDMIKYTKASHFSMVLGLLGVSSLFRLSTLVFPSIPNAVGDVLTVIAVVVYVAVAGLYAVKFWRYPRKVMKEFWHPVSSNALIIVPCGLVLVSLCCYGRFTGSETLGRVLYWIGAPLTLLYGVILAAGWVQDLHSLEHVNAAWLLPPTANLVSSFCLPYVYPGDANMREAAMVWTAYGVALGVPAYVAAMYKSFVVFEADDRIRPLKWGLVAWTSMLSITTFSGMTPATATATAATLSSPLIYLFSLVLAMVLGLLFVTGHFSQLKFDVTSTWMMAFPIDALAIATLLYYQTVPGVLTQGMAYAGLATAAVATIVLTLHTINAALMNKLWTMDPKYGPLSQQILTHEAFRAASIRLEKQAECLVASGGKNIGEFARQFREFRVVHHWHAVHEDKVIFATFEQYVPGSCDRQHHEHERDEVLMQRWAKMIEMIEAGNDRSIVRSQLYTELKDFLADFELHLQGEEMHLQRLGRKQLNVDLQKAMIRSVWDMTPVDVWQIMMPWIVENAPMHQQRVKFVRAWLWSVPERAQLIGRMIYMKCDPAIWERLVVAVPEIVPRGVAGWRRFY